MSVFLVAPPYSDLSQSDFVALVPEILFWARHHFWLTPRDTHDVAGASSTLACGEGEACGAFTEWRVRVRKGARRLLLNSIHSSQRVGQPL